jgi:hypothetical protein
MIYHRLKTKQNGTILISLLLLLHCILLFSMMIILSNLHFYSYIKNYARDFQLELNTISAANSATVQPEIITGREFSFTSSLFGSDSTTVHFIPWGFYTRLNVTSMMVHHKTERSFLVFSTDPFYEHYTLILTGGEGPLTLSPFTKISGNIMLDEDMDILNRNKDSDYKVFRTHSTSGLQPWIRNLKRKARDLTHIIESLTSGISNSHVNNSGLRSILSRDSFLMSELFSQNTIRGPARITFTRDVFLKNLSFTAGVVLVSSSKIIFDETVKAEELLVFARNIELRGNTLNGHFYATERISINKNSRLMFPSVTGLIYETITDSSGIIFGENTILQGAALVLGDCLDKRGSTQNMMRTSVSTQIDGVIVTDGLVELQGNVRGTVIAKGFFRGDPPTGFVNHTGTLNLQPIGGKSRLLWPVTTSFIHRSYDVFAYSF